MAKVTKIKIRVVLTVDVDRESYDAEYGTHESVNDIRAHIEGVAVTAFEAAFEYIDAVQVERRSSWVS